VGEPALAGKQGFEFGKLHVALAIAVNGKIRGTMVLGQNTLTYRVGASGAVGGKVDSDRIVCRRARGGSLGGSSRAAYTACWIDDSARELE
jgi:hypothetical protein